MTRAETGTGDADGTAVAGQAVAPAFSARGTRARVVRLLLENGPATTPVLAGWLGLTTAAVRRHIDALLADNLIEMRTQRPQGRRGRGRPARAFAITDAGRDALDGVRHTYGDLAASALRFLVDRHGEDAVAEFARRRVAELERRYRPALESAPSPQRVRALAEALSGDGYAATARAAPPVAGGEQLCQHHCPVMHVAEAFPQLCEAETEVFGRLLGTPVQRLATIAHGDGVCTTHVSPPGLGSTGEDVPRKEPAE